MAKAKGEMFREARKTWEQEEDKRERQADNKNKWEFRKNLSNWFNDIAAMLPPKVEAKISEMQAGKWVDPRFDYTFSDRAIPGPVLNNIETFNIRSLPGYKAMEKASKALNIDVSVTRTYFPSLTVSNAAEVHFDMAKPYKPPSKRR